MGLPSISSAAKNTLGSTLLGRLLGTSVHIEEEPVLPQLKFKPGEEPHTPRAGSPGFQNGHWVGLFGQKPSTEVDCLTVIRVEHTHVRTWCFHDTCSYHANRVCARIEYSCVRAEHVTYFGTERGEVKGGDMLSLAVGLC